MLDTNCIEVTGGFAAQRERVLDVITFCIDEMMPRKRTLDIEVKLWNSSMVVSQAFSINLGFLVSCPNGPSFF